MTKTENYYLPAVMLVFLCLTVFLFCSKTNNTVGDDNNIGPVMGDSLIANHYATSDFDLIPSNYRILIADSLKIFYGHTSHGSQIMTGLDMIEAENSNYAQPTIHEISDDLGHNGDTSWVPLTRTWLNANTDYNVVVWSWCGGCSDNTTAGINAYLAALNRLEADYPNVIFIYMTGHLDGTGESGDLHLHNEQIRKYCRDNNKWLFDFADIESWDPDGNYYLDENADDACNYDGGNWAVEWQNSHSDGEDWYSCGSAHSEPLNANMKAFAVWWLFSQIAAQI